MAGNPGAFERFVDHFRSKIFKYASLICGQREFDAIYNILSDVLGRASEMM